MCLLITFLMSTTAATLSKETGITVVGVCVVYECVLVVRKVKARY